MRRMNRDGLARKGALVVAVLAVVFVCGWVIAGLGTGLLSAIAIGTGVAVAIFSGGQRNCSPRFLRRREQ